MNNRPLSAVIVIAAVAVIGFLFYRQSELEDRLLQQQQQAQLESQKLQTELAAKEQEASALREAQKRVFDRIEARDRARADVASQPANYIKGGSNRNCRV
jgi:hypothetical protein